MQPIAKLNQWLTKNASPKHYLFSTSDLRPLIPTLSQNAFTTLLNRAVQKQLLIRVCRGLYMDPANIPKNGLTLYHIAAQLRSNHFNYLSLETILSEAGIISQIPINTITLMSSGRSSTIQCQAFGSIEFVHTNKKPADLRQHLVYNTEQHLWRADIKLALLDIKTTGRSKDLIDWERANELI